MLNREAGTGSRIPTLGAVQVYPREVGGSRVVWTADVLPDEAAATIGAMMREGAAAMNTAFTRLVKQVEGKSQAPGRESYVNSRR